MPGWRFLFDQHVNAPALRRLREAGIDVVHAAEVGVSEADDPDILAWAAKENRIVVTRNYRDFAPLVEAYVKQGIARVSPSPLDILKEHGHRSFRPPRGEAMADRPDLLQGTLELLVLKALSLHPMHGWGMAQRIEQMSRGTFGVNQGSLYPALQRMKRKGWLTSKWGTTENNRRARYYSLTARGERQLSIEREEWERTAQGVNWVLQWEGGGI